MVVTRLWIISSIICSVLQVATDICAIDIRWISIGVPSPGHFSSSGTYPLDPSCLGDPTATACLTLRIIGTHKPLLHGRFEIQLEKELVKVNIWSLVCVALKLGHFRKQTGNTLRALKRVSGEGWRRSFGSIVWEMKEYYVKSRKRGIQNYFCQQMHCLCVSHAALHSTYTLCTNWNSYCHCIPAILTMCFNWWF